MNGKLPTPKRGAFPTPKDVRDKAPPYVPDPDTADDRQDDATHHPPSRTQPQGNQGGADDEDTSKK